LKFTVDKEIFSKYAPLKIAAVILENINNNADIDDFWNAEFAAIEKSVQTKFADIELGDYPVIRRWREIYKSFGEKDARSSIEALIKRIRNGKGLYRINPLVDLYNLASLKFELPAGGENLDKMPGDLKLAFADGTEKFLELGATEFETPAAGEVIYKSGDIVVCRNFNYRDSEITKLAPNTTQAIIVFEDISAGAENLMNAVDCIAERAASLLGAKAKKTIVLDAAKNEAELD